MTAHISGHIDLTGSEFAEHYIPRISDALAEGHHFVVGDAKGTDTIAKVMLELFAEAAGSSVTVYHMFDSPRFEVGCNTKLVGGYQTDNDRDVAMTRASDYDIAWVRPGREKSGTAKNIRRRAKLAK